MIRALHDAPAALLSLTALMWASNAISGQLAVGQITPYSLVLGRWVLVAAVMSALYGRELIAYWPVARARLGAIAFMSLCGFTGFNTLFYIAAEHTSGLNIGIIQGAMPVMVLLGAWAAYREPIGMGKLAGVMTTLAGVALIAAQGSLETLTTLAFRSGDLLMLAAAAIYCVYTVALRMRPEMPGVVLFTLFSIIALVSAMPLALWEMTSPDYVPPSLEGWGIMIFVAIFPSCLAQLFFLRGVDLIGPGRAGVYINLVPIFTAILAVALLGERFAWHHGLALALVVGGIWLTQRAPAPGKT